MNYELQTQMLRVVVQGIPDGERTPQRIREEISETADKLGFGLIDQQVEDLARNFEIQFNVHQDFGFVIRKKNSEPWWQMEVENGLNTHYSSRFHEYILQDEKAQLPVAVANRTNEVTDQIIDLVGNPKLDGHWKRRGMVIGHVQSGKTLNYSSVITKAADAGYRVILLLAGLTNSLRKQTQDRIDHAFIGKQSLEQNTSTKKIGAARFVNGELARHPNYLTSLERDFSKSSVLANLGVQFGTSTEPMIFVSKKNVSTLKNIYEFISDMRDTGLLQEPFLMIDDEADNASINTLLQHDKVSAINQSLRNILSLFDKSSYLGYTATPFANIFIDPDSEDEMGNDDLFPADYIKTLEAPTNYVGPEEVFGEHGHLSETMVITPNDYSHILDLKHKSDLVLDELPASLEEAVLLFIIAKAIRNWRGQKNKHCSMMVNVSRFNNVQKQTHDLIIEFLEKIKNDINSYSKLQEYPEKSILNILKKLFDEEFISKADEKNADHYPDWNELDLFRAVRFMRVSLVNMNSQEPLNFGDEPLTVIAVGGLALSRGLTLEGLTVSYILRNASAYDTLMQMGRWFGYRPGYEDLCRLYIPDSSKDHYSKTTSAISELRDELQVMQDLGKTPAEFGLKVRSHPRALAITAANKMRTAEKVDYFHGLGGRTVEGHALYCSDISNDHNRVLTSKFLHELGLPKSPNSTLKQSDLFWDGVPKEKILTFVKEFELPPLCTEFEHNPELGGSVFSKFVRSGGEYLDDWQVAVANDVTSDNSSGGLLKNVELKRLGRENGKIDRFSYGEVYSFTKRRKVSSPIHAEIGLAISDIQGLKNAEDFNSSGNRKQISAAKYNRERTKPILIIYEIDAMLEERPIFQDKAVSFAVHFPHNDAFEAVRVTYAINKIAQQQELPFWEGDDGDEAMELNSFQENA